MEWCLRVIVTKVCGYTIDGLARTVAVFATVGFQRYVH